MKYIKSIFYVCTVLVFGYFILGQVFLPADTPKLSPYIESFDEGWTYRLEDGTTGAMSIPGDCDEQQGGVVYFENTLPSQMNELITCLVYRSVRQDLEIFIDGEKRLSYSTKDTRLIGRNSAVATVVLMLRPEDCGKDIVVKTRSLSTQSGQMHSTYLGNQLGFLDKYIKDNGKIFVFAFVTFILALVCVIISFALFLVYRQTVPLFYLGTGVLFAAVWLIMNSQLRQFVFPSISVVNDMAFLMIMIMPFPFMIYMNDIQKGRYCKGYIAFGILATVNFTGCLGLHIAKLIDFSKSILYSSVICVLAIIFMFTVIIVDVIRGYVKEYALIAMGLACALGCAVVQIITYFNSKEKFDGMVLAMGLLILLIISAVDTAVNVISNENSKRAAVSAGEAKGRFLANMSHEIRTPITAVLGMNEMILRESRESNIKEYAMDIQTAGQSLLSIINDILDMSKIESGKMELVPVDYDFSSVVHDVMNMVRTKADAKDLYVKLNIDDSLPARLYGDDVRIRQILTNIMNNAVKYTEKGGVTLSITGETLDGVERLHFDITDTGIGIKDSDLGKLFSAFERIEESRNRNIEGTGLGMTITMQLLKMMDSELQVNSVYGQGTSFFFDLEQPIMDFEPIGDLGERIKQQAQAYEYSSTFIAPEADVLVVDDNHMNRKVFRNLLKDTQIRIDEADGGSVCLEKVAQNHYDIIFLDHMMPEMDGIETLHRMKEMEANQCKDSYIVALTANAISGAREMYLEEGFDDFLSKPVMAGKLEEMIQKHLPETKIKWMEGVVESVLDTEQGGSEQTMDMLAEIPELNMDYAKMITPDTTSMVQLINDFWQSAAGEANRLEADYGKIVELGDGSEEAYKAYRIQVHSMKSSAALIGAMGVSGVAQMLEDAAAQGDMDILQNLTPIFLTAWRTLREKLSGICDTTDDTADLVAFDADDVMGHIHRLQEALAEMDIDTADEIVSLLKQYQYDEKRKPLMEKVYEAAFDLSEEELDEIDFSAFH